MIDVFMQISLQKTSEKPEYRYILFRIFPKITY